MAYSVGQKGQVVIAKEIRDRLGIEPGWVSIQTLVGDHVEIYFLPPPHNRSLKGSLSKYIDLRPDIDEDDWSAVKDKAWEDAINAEADQWEPRQ